MNSKPFLLLSPMRPQQHSLKTVVPVAMIATAIALALGTIFLFQTVLPRIFRPYLNDMLTESVRIFQTAHRVELQAGDWFTIRRALHQHHEHGSFVTLDVIIDDASGKSLRDLVPHTLVPRECREQSTCLVSETVDPDASLVFMKEASVASGAIVVGKIDTRELNKIIFSASWILIALECLGITILGLALFRLFKKRVMNPIGNLALCLSSRDRSTVDNYLKIAVPRSTEEQAIVKALEGYLADLTFAQKEKEAALLRASGAEKAKAIAGLVSYIAHDVRRPFSLLKTVINTLPNISNQKDMLPFLQKYLPEVDRSILSIEGFLTDIMHANSDTHHLHIESCRFSELLDESFCTIFRSSENHDIALHLLGTKETLLEVDRAKVQRIFINIIGNAAEAMHWRGSITVRVANLNGRVEITIANTGSFIKAEDLGRIFESYYTNNKKCGTGLGLAIAKKWVNAHGGQISCRSDRTIEHPDGQAEFVFDLPGSVCTANQGQDSSMRKNSRDYLPGFSHSEHLRAAEDTAHRNPDACLQTNQKLDQILPKIALIDDSSIVRLNWKMKLKGKAQLDLFESPESFFTSCAGQYDVVVTDMNFDNSDKNGGDVARFVRVSGVSRQCKLSSNVDYQPEVSDFTGFLQKGSDLSIEAILAE